MGKVSHGFKGLLSSSELNQRFADFAGGSIINGFRLALGSTANQVSIVRGNGKPSVLFTTTGARLEEDQDVMDAVVLAPHNGELERYDVVYAVYQHGEGSVSFTYEASTGVDGEGPDFLTYSNVRTPIGCVRVRPGKALETGDLMPIPLGLKLARTYFEVPLDLPNGLTAKWITIDGDAAATELYVDASLATSKAYTDGRVTGLVDGAPDALATLRKLAQAIDDDPDFAGTTLNRLATKVDQETYAAHVADLLHHVTQDDRDAWDAKETPEGAQAKADAAEASAKSYADQRVAELVDSSPETLDTLNELAQALGDDPNFAVTMTEGLAQKVDKTTFEAHEGDTLHHVDQGDRDAWDAKETPEGAQAKADAAEQTAKAHADQRITDLVNGAPEGLGTLDALAQSIGDDPDLKGTIDEALATKVDKTAFAAHEADMTHHVDQDDRDAWYGMVPKSTVGTPGGPVALDESLLIPVQYIPTLTQQNFAATAVNGGTTDLNLRTAAKDLYYESVPANAPGGVTADAANPLLVSVVSTGNYVTQRVTQTNLRREFFRTFSNGAWKSWVEQETTASSQTKVNTHAADTIKHVSPSERDDWNGKLDKTGGTITGPVDITTAGDDPFRLESTGAQVGLRLKHASGTRYIGLDASNALRLSPNADLSGGETLETTNGSQGKADAAREAAKVWARTYGLGDTPNAVIPANEDLDGIIASGFYRLQTGHGHAPSGSDFGQMIVVRGGGDTVAQLLIPYTGGTLAYRSGNPASVGGSGDFGPWSRLATTDLATIATSGLMDKTDKSKLDGIAVGANNYIHPSGDGNLHVPATGVSNNRKFLMAGLAEGDITWQSILFSDLANKPTTLAGYGITDAFPVNGGALSGALTINSNSAAALSLKGGTSNHVFIQFYARSSDQSARSGYMGYSANGTTTFLVNNSIGDIALTAVGGNVLANGSKVIRETELGTLPALTTTNKTTIVEAINEVNAHKDNLNVHMTVSERTQFNKIRFDEFDPLSVSANTRDANAGIYKVVEYKRPNGTLYLKSTASNPTAENLFRTITLQYYGADGVTVTETQTWAITYDAQGGIVTKTKQ